MPLAITTHDDRGRAVPLFDSGAMIVSHPRAHRAANAALSTNTTPLRRWLFTRQAAIVFAVLFLGGTIVLVCNLFVNPRMRWVAWPAVCTIGFVGGTIAIRESRRISADAIRVAVLATQSCASCGYPLDASPVAEDGCTVCPECGAAWRLTRCAGPAPT